MAQRLYDISLLLEYSTDSITWVPIISGLGADYGIGSYVWDVPDVTSDTVFIRFINLADGSILDTVGPLNLVSTTSITDLIKSVEDVDEQLNKLIDWANSISWCSRSVLDTFQTYDLIIPSSSLILNEYHRLTIPDNPVTNHEYVAHTPLITFEPDRLGEQVPLEAMSTRWSAQYKIVTYGEASVKIEFSTNQEITNWFTLYDNSDINNITDKSYSEILAKSDLNGVYPTNNVKIRYTIITDSLGRGGYIEYFALLGNPSLF